MEIYTVGHSNHPIEQFVALLKQQDIEVLVDVRSQPYSRYVPHFNRESLARAVAQAGLVYRFMGDRLGGRPDDDSVLTTNGAVDRDKLAADESYREGIDTLLALATGQRVAIMCSEGDHHRCHRGSLITPTLLQRGVTVLHIQPDGSVVDAASEPKQLSLF